MKNKSIVIVGLLVLITIGYVVYSKLSPAWKVYKNLKSDYNMTIPTNINQALRQVENVVSHATSHKPKPDSSFDVPKTKPTLNSIEYTNSNELWVEKDGKKKRYSDAYPPIRIDSSGVTSSKIGFRITTGISYSFNDSLSNKIPSPTIAVEIGLPKKLVINSQLKGDIKNIKQPKIDVFVGYRW